MKYFYILYVFSVLLIGDLFASDKNSPLEYQNYLTAYELLYPFQSSTTSFDKVKECKTIHRRHKEYEKCTEKIVPKFDPTSLEYLNSKVESKFDVDSDQFKKSMLGKTYLKSRNFLSLKGELNKCAADQENVSNYIVPQILDDASAQCSVEKPTGTPIFNIDELGIDDILQNLDEDYEQLSEMQTKILNDSLSNNLDSLISFEYKYNDLEFPISSGKVEKIIVDICTQKLSKAVLTSRGKRSRTYIADNCSGNQKKLITEKIEQFDKGKLSQLKLKTTKSHVEKKCVTVSSRGKKTCSDHEYYKLENKDDLNQIRVANKVSSVEISAELNTKIDILNSKLEEIEKKQTLLKKQLDTKISKIYKRKSTTTGRSAARKKSKEVTLLKKAFKKQLDSMKDSYSTVYESVMSGGASDLTLTDVLRSKIITPLKLQNQTTPFAKTDYISSQEAKKAMEESIRRSKKQIFSLFKMQDNQVKDLKQISNGNIEDYKNNRYDDLVKLWKTNPVSTSRILLQDTKYSDKACQIINRLNSEIKSDEFWDKAFMVAGVGVGVAAIATGVFSAAGATISVAAANTIATTAYVASVSYTAAAVNYKYKKFNKSKDHLENILNSYFSSNSRDSISKEIGQQEIVIRKNLIDVQTEIGLGLLDVFSVMPMIKASNEIAQKIKFTATSSQKVSDLVNAASSSQRAFLRNIVLNMPEQKAYEYIVQISKISPASRQDAYLSLSNSILESFPKKEGLELLSEISRLPASTIKLISESSENYVANFLKYSLNKGPQQFKEALSLLGKDEELMTRFIQAHEALIITPTNKKDLIVLVYKTKGTNLKSKIESALKKSLAQTDLQDIDIFFKKKKFVQNYSETLNQKISNYSKIDLKINITSALDDYKHIYPDAPVGDLKFKINDYFNHLSDSEFTKIKQKTPNQTLDIFINKNIIKVKKAPVLSLNKTIDSEWKNLITKACKVSLSPKALKKCINATFTKINSSKKGFFKRNIPCLMNNSYLMKDFLFSVGVFTTLGVYNFGDKAFKMVKESNNPDASFWREMEYEYILNVYLYALKNGELSCRSASSGGSIVDFGGNISTASMVSKSDSFAEVFIKNFPGMMKVQTKSILSLTAMQYVADRALDRIEKRSLSKLALEFPGKLLYFGVSGSIKSIAVNRYLKNMFVPWLSKAIFGQKIGSKDSVLMAFLVPLDKGLIGQLNLKDQVEWSGPLLFNIGEVIMASMAYKQASEEDLQSLPKETREFLKLSNMAFEQALKEGDLTLDDISVESDPNDPKNLKFSISNVEKLNKLREKFAKDIAQSKDN